MAEEQQREGKGTRVLIGVDNSYAEHVHKPANEVILFHVSDQIRMPTYALLSEGMAFSPDDVRHRVEELRQKNKELEDKYNSKCSALHMKHKFLTVTEDTHGPGHAIVEAAKKHHVDLIIVGSRGQGALRRTVMGSISTYVVHHSHIPALVCPPLKHHHHDHHHH